MANFYGTATGYKAYELARGRAIDPGLDDDEIDAALLVASEWLDRRYGETWAIGTLKTGGRAQVREWPRAGFVDYQGYGIPNDEIPLEMQNATYEVARRQIQSPGSLSKDFTPSKYKQASVDGAVSVTYNTGVSSADVQLQIPEIEGILYPLLNSPYAGENMSGLSGRVARV